MTDTVYMDTTAYLGFSPDNLFVNCITADELSEGFSLVTRDGRFLTTDSVKATYKKGMLKFLVSFVCPLEHLHNIT